MVTPDPEPFEKEFLTLPDGRSLVLYRFPEAPAGPGDRPERPAAGDPPPPARGER